MKESDIMYEKGRFWVYRDIKCNAYTVYKTGSCASTPDSSYRMDSDGLSIAIARADYKARMDRVPL